MPTNTILDIKIRANSKSIMQIFFIIMRSFLSASGGDYVKKLWQTCFSVKGALSLERNYSKHIPKPVRAFHEGRECVSN